MESSLELTLQILYLLTCSQSPPHFILFLVIFMLTLAYTVVSFRYKMFDWSMLTNLLFIIAICIQLNTLYIMFWASCFSGFNATSSFGTTHLVTGVQCALCIIITVF